MKMNKFLLLSLLLSSFILKSDQKAYKQQGVNGWARVQVRDYYDYLNNNMETGKTCATSVVNIEGQNCNTCNEYALCH